MQCVSKDYPTSFVITDPKGSLIGEVGQLLVRCGYRVKVLNTINFSKSMRYNPFRYIHSEKDILKLVNTLICNTKGEGEKSAEDFWIKSERLLYSALIGYIWYEAPDDEMNFTTLLEMINASEAREDDPEFQSPVDQMFERLEEKDPEHFAVRQYRKFLLSAGKTRSSILISCGARLAPFDIREVRELMEDDELELDTIGDKKTALFLIMSDTDTTFNFILAMVQSQLINLLCDRADDKYGGRLPVHVRLILDEFANIGQIPNFDKLIATIRSREISASIILQSQSQLKAIYKDAAEIISDNCDCTLFLSGRGKNAKEIAEVLGKETIDSYNQSENRGAQTSHGLNYQKLGKELMSQDEIATMDGGKCILQVRGVRPFFSEKYDITRHPRYQYLSDADKKNTFDVDSYPLVKRLHGQVVKLSPTSKNYVNPLDINLNYSEDENPLALKSDFVLSFCELVMGGKNGLEAIEKTVIDRAVQVIYRPYLADPKPENMPILADLHKALLDQHIPEADRVAQALDLYVSGSLNVFNHRTNIDIKNRIVAFDIKELGKQLKKIGMLIVQDQIWGRVTQNRSKGKATWYFCDEFHLLLREEQTAAFSCEIWKRFRKWGGIPTGATQNVKDLLSSPEIENILENSDFICLLNQASGDRKILAERLNISPQQLRYVDNSEPGEGLLIYENVILPFKNPIPKNTQLYQIMTTRLGEGATV